MYVNALIYIFLGEKKLVYTESSMLIMKYKLLFGLLDKLYKKHCLQYPFQLIQWSASSKQTAAIQFYQQQLAAVGVPTHTS